MVVKVTAPNSQEVTASLRNALEEFTTNEFLTVGIHEDEGTHDDAAGLTNAKLGAILHFGTDDGRIPPRHWLDVGVASRNQEYLTILEDAIADGANLGEALEMIGPVAQAAAQQYMRDLRSPENAPRTIAKKKSSNPLIDTGELVESVKYRVQTGKPEEGM